MRIRRYFSKGCNFIFYQWDGVQNNPNALKIAGFFDITATFDPMDARKYK